VCGWPVGDALLGEDVAAPDNACQGSASLQSGMLLSKIVAFVYITISFLGIIAAKVHERCKFSQAAYSAQRGLIVRVEESFGLTRKRMGRTTKSTRTGSDGSSMSSIQRASK
jgi:hypothetical protein